MTFKTRNYNMNGDTPVTTNPSAALNVSYIVRSPGNMVYEAQVAILL
jgi:hypothetical protein